MIILLLILLSLNSIPLHAAQSASKSALFKQAQAHAALWHQAGLPLPANAPLPCLTPGRTATLQELAYINQHPLYTTQEWVKLDAALKKAAAGQPTDLPAGATAEHIKLYAQEILTQLDTHIINKLRKEKVYTDINTATPYDQLPKDQQRAYQAMYKKIIALLTRTLYMQAITEQGDATSCTTPSSLPPYTTFVHGQGAHLFLPIDLYTILWSIKYKTPVRQDFTFLQIRPEEERKEYEHNAAMTAAVMEYGLNLYSEQDEVLFMNYALTANTLRWGGSTIRWTMGKENVVERLQGGLTKVLKLLGAPHTAQKYKAQLDVLNQQYADLSEFGTIYLISVPSKDLNNAVRVVAAGGYTRTMPLITPTSGTPQESANTSDIIKALRAQDGLRLAKEFFDQPEFLLPISAGLLNPQSTIKIVRLTEHDEQNPQFKQLMTTYHDLVQQIIPAFIAEVTSQPQEIESNPKNKLYLNYDDKELYLTIPHEEKYKGATFFWEKENLKAIMLTNKHNKKFEYFFNVLNHNMKDALDYNSATTLNLFKNIFDSLLQRDYDLLMQSQTPKNLEELKKIQKTLSPPSTKKTLYKHLDEVKIYPEITGNTNEVKKTWLFKQIASFYSVPLIVDPNAITLDDNTIIALLIDMMEKNINDQKLVETAKKIVTFGSEIRPIFGTMLNDITQEFILEFATHIPPHFTQQPFTEQLQHPSIQQLLADPNTYWTYNNSTWISIIEKEDIATLKAVIKIQTQDIANIEHTINTLRNIQKLNRRHAYNIYYELYSLYSSSTSTPTSIAEQKKWILATLSEKIKIPVDQLDTLTNDQILELLIFIAKKERFNLVSKLQGTKKVLAKKTPKAKL